jgi:hypothetical protein
VYETEKYKSKLFTDFAFFQVEVIFVDFGNTELINPSDLISLETLRKSVAEFPHQVSSFIKLSENIVF